jgi:uncharacterized repeat protein (TIGR03803 family)
MKKLYLLLCWLTASVFSAPGQPVLYTPTRGNNYLGTISKYDAGTNSLAAVYNFQAYGHNPVGEPVQGGNGKLYGMTNSGGHHGRGTIYTYDPGSGSYTTVKDFSNTDGVNPYGSLTLASDGKLYGMTYSGGASSNGVLFSFDPVSNAYTKLKDFSSSDGANPYIGSRLYQASDGKLYGMTCYGGAYNKGVIFSFDLGTKTYSKLMDFDGPNGAHPYSSFFQAADGLLYGATGYGGLNDHGVLFSFDPTSYTYNKLHSFDGTNGSHPFGRLTPAAGGKLYSVTIDGGSRGHGTIFSFDPASNSFSKLKDFDYYYLGANPYSDLTLAPNGKLYGLARNGGYYYYGNVFSFDPAAAALETVFNFNGGSDGRYPHCNSLALASDGKLYGTVFYGNTSDWGTFFSLNPVTRSYVSLFSFQDMNGINPSGRLTKGPDGKFYGMTQSGGSNSRGVIYSFDPASYSYKKLKDFNGADGSQPYYGNKLTLAPNGKLYGMTLNGGLYGYGVIFSYDPLSGTYNKLMDFKISEGTNPYGSLTLGPDGKFYGMTGNGGQYGYGVLFSFDGVSGTYTKLKELNNTDGSYSYGSLTLAPDGKLYGMTHGGGANGAGTIFSYDLSTSTYTRLQDFNGQNGATPFFNELVTAPDGKLYGTTYLGGANGYGVLFAYDPAANTITKLQDFNYHTNGAHPYGGLTLGSNGRLYGMTYQGGTSGKGVIFSYNPATSTFSKLKEFDGSNGAYPLASTFTEEGSCVAPTPTIESNGPVCEGGVLTLKASGGTTYSWSGPNKFSSTAQNPTIEGVTAAAAGTYTVTVSVGACPATATVDVVIHPTPAKPVITPAGPLTTCPGKPLTLEAGTATSYLWSSGETTPSIQAATTGTYTVTIKDEHDCSATSDAVLLTVEDVQKPVITTNGNKEATTAKDQCGAVVAVSATADDNCSVGEPAGVRSDGKALDEAFPVGTSTITWNVQDANGNAADPVTQTVTVTDGQKPVITTNGDQDVVNDPGQCGAKVTVTASAADNCTIGNPSGSRSDGRTLEEAFLIGTTIITWNVTDAAGNAADPVIQKVTVRDGERPAITAPAAITAHRMDAGKCFATVALGTPVTADNCGIKDVKNDAPATFALGTTTVTWTVTDVHGHTATATQEVTVEDGEDPLITAPGAVTTTTSADGRGDRTTTAALGTPVAKDNCTVASLKAYAEGKEIDPATYTFGVGTTTVTWTVRDGAGRAASATQEVIVSDDENPAITAPGPVTVNTDDGSNVATGVTLGTPATSDNCGVERVTNDAPASFPVGTTTITWTVTDVHGRTAMATQTVTVTDNQLPVIKAPADLLDIKADRGQCSATLTSLGLPEVSDNCGVAESTITNNAPATFPIGTTIVEWTVQDIHGNTSIVAHQTVTVSDDQLPTITVPADVTIVADKGSCSATGVALGDPVTGDNCSVESVTNDAPASFTIGTTTVTWIVKDRYNNTRSATQKVTVTDDQPPVIAPPAPINVRADKGLCTATVAISQARATDNCSVGAPTGTRSDGAALDAPYPVGTTIITWRVSDVHNNTATPVEQTVTVTDEENPVITAPATARVTADQGRCEATSVAIGTATATDNCGVENISSNAPAAFPIGTTTVTWTATDIHGRTATATQEVVVTDNELPLITAPKDISIAADAGQCFASNVSLGVPMTSDNCGIDESSLTNNAPDRFSVGSSKVQWTVKDVHGNTSLVAEQTVVVTDNEHPTLVAPGGVTVKADIGSCWATGVELGTPTTGDNCGVKSVTNDAPGSYPVGTTLVTWTVTDEHDNTTTATQTVTVVDEQKPVITTNGDKDVVNDPGQCGAKLIITASAADNCGVGDPVSTRSDGKALGDLFAVGTTTITWTVTDIHDNTQTVTQIVTVRDAEKPVITTNGNLNVNTDAGQCSAIVAVSATARDNCGAGSPVGTRSDGAALDAPYPVGTTTITWTATDVHDNTAIPVTQTVTVTDNRPPVITAPVDVTVTADKGSCSATGVSLGVPVTSDNCGVERVTNNAPAFFPLGTTRVTWTVTDIHGLTQTATQVVTVADREAPVVTKNEAVVKFCYNTSGLYTVPRPEATDNCTGTAPIVPAGTRNDGKRLEDPYPVGTTTITWTLADAAGNTATCQTTVMVNSALTLSIPTVKALNYPGIEANTVYLGYAPTAALTLTADVQGGTGNYKYAWSPGGGSARSIEVRPATIGPNKYTVEVSDDFDAALNCSAVGTFTVEVLDASCGPDGGKVNMCHITNPNDPNHVKTICIDAVSVADHLAKGCKLDACLGTGMIAWGVEPEVIADGFTLKASPNPSAAFFHVKVETSNVTERINLRVIDVKGRVVEVRQSVQPNQTLFIGDTYRPGIYFIEVVQGRERRNARLIKLSD